jgi:hypothetical protein
MLAPLFLAVVTNMSGAVDMTEDEYRLYCGYLDAIEKPEVQKIAAGPHRDKSKAAKPNLKPAVF